MTDVGGPMRVYRVMPVRGTRAMTGGDVVPPVRFGEAGWLVVPEAWWAPQSTLTREGVPW